MKITQNTPDRLMLDHVTTRALFLPLGLIAFWVAMSWVWVNDGQIWPAIITLLVGVPIPAFIIWYSARRSQLVLDHTDGTLEIRHRTFRGYTRQTLPIAALERVYIGRKGPEQGRLFFEITNTMDAGHHSFPHHPGPIAKVTQIHAAIEDWLAR